MGKLKVQEKNTLTIQKQSFKVGLEKPKCRPKSARVNNKKNICNNVEDVNEKMSIKSTESTSSVLLLNETLSNTTEKSEKCALALLPPKQKLSVNQLRKTSCRKIPKNILEQTLDMLNNEHHEIWKEKNISCMAPINHYYEDFRTVKMKKYTLKLKYARECLLRRDWKNLGRIITMCITDDTDEVYYPIFAKYAAICLAYNDLEQFKQFMKSHGVIDENNILKLCTTIKRNTSFQQTVT